MSGKKTAQSQKRKHRPADVKSAGENPRNGCNDAIARDADMPSENGIQGKGREDYNKMMLLTIRRISQLIIREDNPQRLIERACTSLTELSCYVTAWIALLDDKRASVTTAASSGFNGAFKEQCERLVRGDYPLCMRRALEQDETVVVTGLKTDCEDCPLLSKHHSLAVLIWRLAFEGTIYGILSVSVPTQTVFSEEEHEFFREIADDLAFALHKIKTAEKLRDSQRDLKRAQAIAKIGSWCIDLNSGSISTSEEARRIYGLIDDEYTYEHVKTIPLPQYRPALDTALTKLIRDGLPYNIEFDILRPSDNTIHHIHSIAEYDAEKNIVIGTIHDITDQKRIEEALRESESNLIESQHLAQLGRWEHDLITNQLNWSDTIFEIFELDSRTFKASLDSFLGLVYPDDRELVNLSYSTSLVEREPYSIEHRLLMQDGRIKWLYEMCRTEYDGQGNPVRSVGIVQDITTRKQTEEALRRISENLQAILDYSPLLISEISAEGKYLHVNSATAEVYKISPSELTGKRFREILPAETADLFMDRITRVVETKQPVTVEDMIDVSESARYYFSKLYPLFDESGSIRSVGAIAYDITDRKRAEEDTRKQLLRLRALVEILQYRAESVQDFLDHALDKAINLTESKIGYIYFYDENRQQFELNSWSRDVMKECAVVDPQTCYDLDKTGIWGEAVRQRKPILLNDFQSEHSLTRSIHKLNA